MIIRIHNKSICQKTELFDFLHSSNKSSETPPLFVIEEQVLLLLLTLGRTNNYGVKIFIFIFLTKKVAQFRDQQELLCIDLPLLILPHVAPCRRRWCSMLGQTHTTSSTFTTVCETSCWTWTTASRAFCSRCGTKARTFLWRLAHHLTSCLLKIKELLKKKKQFSTNFRPLVSHFLLLLSFFRNFMPQPPSWQSSQFPNVYVFNPEIYEAHIHGGVVPGAAEAAEEDF